MDGYGYPTRAELRKVERWPVTDFAGWMEYIRGIWSYADWGWRVSRRGIYRISTAGWSGNEDIIEAMQKNVLLWTLHWYSSRRGGHYQFRAPKVSRRAPRARRRGAESPAGKDERWESVVDYNRHRVEYVRTVP